MTTANKITIFRVVLIPVFLVLMYLRFPGHMYWAFGVFVLASLSDFVDGYIARHYNQVTDFGKFMDPLADKLLVVSAMLMFVEQHQMPAWALLLVVAREFAVTGLRLIAVDNGRVIAAAWSGKIKTASTMVAICLMLLWNIAWLNTVCWVVISPPAFLVFPSERECLQRLIVVRVRRGERLAFDCDAHSLAVEVIEEGVDQTAEIHALTRRTALTQTGKERLVHVKAERIAILRDGEHPAVLRQRIVRDELIHDCLRIRRRDGRLRIRDLRRVGAQVIGRVVREIDLAGRVHTAGGGRLRRQGLRRGGLLRRVLPAAGAQQRQRQHAREQERKVFFHVSASCAATLCSGRVFSSIPHRRAARNLDIAGCIC